ncbi:MAG: metallophosphoesterase [Saprospiraceae bacterium]|nr:metallophosphoesterase [Saprospiraceae bacterium]
MSKLRPHFVLFNGDMTSDDSPAEWKKWLDDWQETIGSDGRLFPIVVARGNHEASNASLVEVFDVVNSGLVYALNFGGNLLRIYTLNSMIPSGGEQRDWLEADLQKILLLPGALRNTIIPCARIHAKKKKKMNWC